MGKTKLNWRVAAGGLCAILMAGALIRWRNGMGSPQENLVSAAVLCIAAALSFRYLPGPDRDEE